MAYSSESDPLLPRNNTAPEINDGSKRPRFNNEVHYIDAPPSYQTQQTQQRDEDDDTRSISGTTRDVVGSFIGLLGVVVFFFFVAVLLSPRDRHFQPPFSPPNEGSSIDERVSNILEKTPLFDGHNDLAIFIRGAYHNEIHTKSFKDKFANGGLEYNVDLPRLRSGKVGGAFWSAFVVCPEDASTDFSDANYATAVSETLSQIDLLRRLQRNYPKQFTPANAPLSTALNRFLSDQSMISPLSIEGLHQIPQSAPMSTLRLYYDLGVRAATLTWNCHNAFADAALIWSKGQSTIAPYHRGGLTPLGRKVIHEMNHLGMVVDLSHTSYWTQLAVLSNRTSVAPVIFSHSSAFSICPHPRNVHDDILKLVKRTNSLVMVNFSPDFISCLPPPDELTLPKFYSQNNTLHQVARHIMYIGEKIGFDHVGLGSDFDGMGAVTPKGLEGVDKYPDLVAELLKMGVSDQDASKVVGGNLLRVWREVERVSKDLQEKEYEGEDEVHGFGDEATI
jgi:membrane dipeptidase